MRQLGLPIVHPGWFTPPRGASCGPEETARSPGTNATVIGQRQDMTRPCMHYILRINKHYYAFYKELQFVTSEGLQTYAKLKKKKTFEKVLFFV